MFEIVRTLKEADRNCDFVALGLGHTVDGGTHSTIIINYESTLYQFHFTGKIEFCNVCHDFFHKITDTINTKLTPSFYAYCRRIEKKANPIYGYFYSGEFYDKNGTHFADKPIGERMTCVGFCLNVLKGFLEEDYILYQDWDETSHNYSGYLIKYAEKYNLNIEEISNSHRRITPLELITSAFFTNIPIKKLNIDSKIDQVQEYIYNNYL